MSGLYTLRPLDDRSGFTGKHREAPFKTRESGGGWRQVSVPFSQTRELLARELHALQASNVILEVDVLPGQIRLDGELYANAKVNSPAVRLHFDSEHGHLTYATDAFTTWQDNVRAIALALEALRKVDRYQVGRGGDQYRGYLALEAGQGIALGGMTREQAYATLVEHAGIDCGPGEGGRLVKLARANTHPDRNGGDQTNWDAVELAAKVLGLTS
jgi:hypothetical protein